MKALLRILSQMLCAMLFLPASVSNAAWINNLTPSSIRLIGPTGDITFAPANQVVIAGCPTNEFYIIKAANNSKSALAILMMAKANAKTVSIYVDDTQPCDVTTGRPMFTNIVLGD